MRRLFLAAVTAAALAAAQPTRADDVVIDLHPGTGADAILGIRNPQAVLYRGGSVDGLPLRRGRNVVMVPWSAMRLLVFIPGDPPAALVTYRDGSQSVFEVAPCRFIWADREIDIHDVAEIHVR